MRKEALLAGLPAGSRPGTWPQRLTADPAAQGAVGSVPPELLSSPPRHTQVFSCPDSQGESLVDVVMMQTVDIFTSKPSAAGLV